MVGDITDTTDAKLRADGYVVICVLSEYGNDEEEALRLGCGYIYSNGTIKALA